MMYITAVLALIGGVVGFALLKHAGDHADDETPESIKHPAPAVGEGGRRIEPQPQQRGGYLPYRRRKSTRYVVGGDERATAPSPAPT